MSKIEKNKYVYQINLKEIIKRKMEYIEKSEVYKDIELENVKKGEIKAYTGILNDIEMQNEEMFIKKYSNIVFELNDRLEKTEYKADVNDMEVEQLTGYNNAIVFVMTLINPKYEFTFD